MINIIQKFESITELYRRTQQSVTAPGQWQDFLTAACRNYKLSFDEQLLVYAQRPDATAVLEIERWNKQFGRWVNRGATGIAVFDGETMGRTKLKYYFDISDTHPGRFSRRVPIWQMRPEYEKEVIETLENRYGELPKKESLATALLSAARNAVEDNMTDYLTELNYYKENSFLEELDDFNVEVAYRNALTNSIGYMLLVRCGIDPRAYFTDDDFRCVLDFNTPDTLNALGTATSDISQMCLSDISKTIEAIENQPKRNNRTFEDVPKVQYPNSRTEAKTPERSIDHGENHIHEAGRLQPAEPSSSAGAGGSPWEVRIDAPKLSEEAPQDHVHESDDIGQVDRASDGDRADSQKQTGADREYDGAGAGRNGKHESSESDEMGGLDEQYQTLSGRNDSDGTDLQLNDEPEEAELPAFTDDRLIMVIIANKDDDLKFKKQQIELFFTVHPELEERVAYIKSAYQDRYTEVIVDGIRVGYKPQEDGLLMWEGAYLSRKSESVFSWGLVTEWTAQLIEKHEYYINTQITPPKSVDNQQMTLFDLASFDAPTSEAEPQMTFFSKPTLPQQVIDTALCLGGNEVNCMERIYAHFIKDYPLKQNAVFLQKEYKRDGKGFFLGDRSYAVWFDENGIRISSGRSASGRMATVLTWEDAAKRVRELLELGRYVPQSVMDRADEVVKKELSEKILYLVGDFTEEARDAGFMPTIRDIRETRKGYPDMNTQLSQLLSDSGNVQTIIDELSDFRTALEGNKDLLRFHYHRPAAIIESLQGLLRPVITFPVPVQTGPAPKQFITDDEIDKLLIGGGNIQHSKFRIYSYYREGHTPKERADFIKNDYGTGGSARMGFDENLDSKGIAYAREDRFFQPCDKILLPWNKVEKRIGELIRQGRYMTEKELEYIPTYEKEMLTRDIYHFFSGVPREQPHPYPAGFDFYEAIKVIQPQLDEPEKVESIYQMMLPVWEATAQDDREYKWRKRGFENMAAFRNGTFSLFGEKKEPKPISAIVEKPAEPEQKSLRDEVIDYLSEAGYVVSDELLNTAMAEYGDGPAKGTADFIIAKLLIDEYCVEEFEQGADYSDLYHVDLAFSSTGDSEHNVEIFADLMRYRLVYQVDGKTVHEIACDSMTALHEYLGNLEFDVMVAQADEWYQQKHPEKEITEDDTKKEPPVKLSRPRQKREQITFSTIHPEIPAAQRSNFKITDDELGYGSPGEKYDANVKAIRCLKRIEAEDRLAIPEEQEILSRYVGWGGLADCFDDRHSKYQELKALLSEDEYAAARASSLTAFYTSPVIIRAMYDALSQMGFQSGNILEPSCGVGNFIGMMPENMEGKAYGVELDSISGRIAQQLYQNSSIVVTGFEKVQMPDSFFDVAIGNVPFGDFKVLDKRYDKYHFLIHDYFFGKALDKVRPGGIIAFITSKGTMDKENSAVRKYLAQRADLIGAIRLPDNAFKQNAGTEVTSDILFLQKRDHMTDIEPDWVHLDTDENGIRMNSYFVSHPDMVLGEMVMESTRFGMDSTCKAYEDADLGEQLKETVSHLRAQITEYEVEKLEEEDLSIPADPEIRNFSFTITDGKIYFRENSRMYPVDVSVTAENRIRGMIALRECVRKLIDLQTEGYPDEDIRAEQARLNTLYDDYTKKYGLICNRGNSLAFSEDSSYYLLCSLEVLDEEGNFKRKADMFTKRTIRSHEAVTSVDTASEALAVSIAEKARVDMDYMSELSGKTPEELEIELAGVIYRNIQCAEDPADISLGTADLSRYPFVTADEYLSGNVRRKLRMVKAMQEVLPSEKKDQISRYVEALEAVQPVDLTAGEIGVRIGVNWVPTQIYECFMYELFGTGGYARSRIKILRSKATGEWNITNKSTDVGNIKALATYGTKRINGYHILEQTLNQKDVRIFDTVIDEHGNEQRVLNKKETAIAQDRQELIMSKFAEWLWKDIDRRELLCGIYNETFNAIRPREYDGQHIRFYGMNPEIQLRPHQINAIAHIMYGGNTLLAHEVGAGKTFEMVAAAMESKRLGLCTKSLIVVPNHITEQWAAEWLQLYPSANILVATKRDFETRNRKKFCARIATGDYDAIIIGHSQFEKIPMSKERQEIIIQRQIDNIMFSIQEAKSARAERYTIKQLEKTKKSLETRLAKLNDQSRKDDVVTFEQLGVDRIFVDESHYFKNLFLATKMRNVGGIAQTEAQKSSDLFMKCQYLDELTGGRGVVFATGTPISNSMVELYTIQRYLQYGTLADMDMLNFDDWAANYGETVTAIELSPEGYTLVGR